MMCDGFVFVRAISIVIGIGISKIDILSVRNSLILPAKKFTYTQKKTNEHSMMHRYLAAQTAPHVTAMKESLK